MKRVSILLLGFLALVKASPIPQSGSPASVSNQQFGAGAAAGVGGLGRSAGIGSFQANPGTAPYLPFGAFAGLGQGSDKLGAGCSGLNCGVQVGDFVLNTRQLFDAFLNSRNPNGNENNAGSLGQLFQRTFGQFLNPQGSQAGPSNGFPSAPFPGDDTVEKPNPNNVADFARSGAAKGTSGFSGGAFSTLFGGSSNRKPFFQSSSTHVDDDGRVIMVEKGPDKPDKITTGKINEAGGIIPLS